MNWCTAVLVIQTLVCQQVCCAKGASLFNNIQPSSKRRDTRLFNRATRHEASGETLLPSGGDAKRHPRQTRVEDMDLTNANLRGVRKVAAEGSHVRFSCDFRVQQTESDAGLDHQVHWEFGKKQIKSSHRIRVRNMLLDDGKRLRTLLTLLHVRPEDAGIYECVHASGARAKVIFVVTGHDNHVNQTQDGGENAASENGASDSEHYSIDDSEHETDWLHWSSTIG